jgi:peptidoglycan/xylan/chitin deacetylase (PgdA/CDA1 family)
MAVVTQGLLELFEPVCRWATRRSVRTLMYHRFSRVPAPRRLGAAVFESQIRFLKEHFEPCSLRQATARLRSGNPLPPNLVVVTVDDGYSDFYSVAYPILRRHRIPATLYVTTGFADQTMWMWFDALRYYLRHAPHRRYSITVDGHRHDIVLGDEDAREAAWHQLGDACLPLTPAARTQALAAVEEAVGVRLPPRPTTEFSGMTWDEIRNLDPELIEIGGHTRTHPVLSRCSQEEIESEVVASKSAIEREIGRPVVSFAYPNGQVDDYDDRVVSAVRRARYDNAVVAYGSFIRRGANLLALERLAPPHEEPEFRKLLTGYSDVMTRARRRLRAVASV